MQSESLSSLFGCKVAFVDKLLTPVLKKIYILVKSYKQTLQLLLAAQQTVNAIHGVLQTHRNIPPS